MQLPSHYNTYVSQYSNVPRNWSNRKPAYPKLSSRLSGSVSIIVLATNMPNPGFLFSMLKKSSLCATTLGSSECIRSFPSSANFWTRLTKSFRRRVAYFSSKRGHAGAACGSGSVSKACGRSLPRTATSTRPVDKPNAVRGLFT